MIAVDASVAAKWFLPEAGSQEATALLQDARARIAPALIRVEVTAAITRKARLGHLSVARAGQAFQEWLRSLQEDAVLLIPDEELLADAVALSFDLKHALQDCLYLAAARRRGIPLITADQVFHGRASAAYPELQLLPGCRAS